MNCKFKFHLRTAPPRGAARPVGPANGRDAFYCFSRPTGSRSKTEFFGFAGRRARTGPAPGLLFPDLQVHGSRSKTEFISFAGRRARTAPAGGLLFPDFQVCGSRSKTEFIDFAGRRARTPLAGELRSDEKRCTEGPAGLRSSLPTIIFPKGKN